MSDEDIKLNEAGGRVFEFITQLVLEEMLPQCKVEWQPKMPQMEIQPDISIRSSDSKLLAVGLVGHATIKSSAAMKTNRNIEELFEIKELPQSPILAISFIWHSENGWTHGQLATIKEAFDFSFVAYQDCGSDWRAIKRTAARLADETKGLVAGEARQLVADSGIHRLVLKHLRPLKEIFELRVEANVVLWAMVRKDYRPHPKTKIGINTSVKVAMQPLMWLPREYLKSVLAGRSIPFNNSTECFVRLGGGKKTIGAVIKPAVGIMDTVRYFGKDVIVGTLNQIGTVEGISFLINSLSSIDALQRRINRVSEAIENSSLTCLCKESIREEDEDFIGRCWPFDVCTAWIKARVDGKFGLLEAQREAIGDTLTDFMWDPIIRYTEGNFRLLSDLQLEKICSYFEKKLQGVKAISSRELSDSLLIESRKKKGLNPLPWLIRETLKANKIKFSGFPESGYSFQCLFTKKAGVGLPSGLTVYQFSVRRKTRTVIIHVLSSYSSTHKDVEYAAKARELRYEYANSSFKRAGKFDVVYVLDGEWSSRHVDLLSGAGVEVLPISQFKSWAETLALEGVENDARKPLQKLVKKQIRDDVAMLEAAAVVKKFGKKK